MKGREGKGREEGFGVMVMLWVPTFSPRVARARASFGPALCPLI
jgi:hypothetical protein